ncbi:MAG: hypothetical protein K2M55_03865 [Muribaculaceae bacterium]|nr:hypothetical protein [Muribaculaceae bacterium]
MSRFFRFIVLIVGCVALLGGIYKFLVIDSPKGDTAAVSGSDSLFVQRSGIIRQHAANIADGWDKNELEAARQAILAVETRLDANKLATLRTSLGSEFVAALDKCISEQYTSDMTSGRHADNPKLREYYYTAAPDLLAVAPEVRNSAHWTHLHALRQAHEKIYSFGENSYGFSARINPRFYDTPAGPRIRCDRAFDVTGYKQGRKNELGELTSLRARHPELVRAPWTNRSLDATVLDSKLNSAGENYGKAERSSVSRFLDGVNRHLASQEPAEGYSAAYLADIKTDLRNLITELERVPGGAGACRSTANNLSGLIDRTYKK